MTDIAVLLRKSRAESTEPSDILAGCTGFLKDMRQGLYEDSELPEIALIAEECEQFIAAVWGGQISNYVEQRGWRRERVASIEKGFDLIKQDNLRDTLAKCSERIESYRAQLTFWLDHDRAHRVDDGLLKKANQEWDSFCKNFWGIINKYDLYLQLDKTILARKDVRVVDAETYDRLIVEYIECLDNYEERITRFNAENRNKYAWYVFAEKLGKRYYPFHSNPKLIDGIMHENIVLSGEKHVIAHTAQEWILLDERGEEITRLSRIPERIH